MKKLIIALSLVVASVSAQADADTDKFCLNLSEVAKQAAKARDNKIPESVALKMADGRAIAPQILDAVKETVKSAYFFKEATPEEYESMIYNICMEP